MNERQKHKKKTATKIRAKNFEDFPACHILYITTCTAAPARIFTPGVPSAPLLKKLHFQYEKYL